MQSLDDFLSWLPVLHTVKALLCPNSTDLLNMLCLLLNENLTRQKTAAKIRNYLIVLIDPMQFDVVSGVMNHGNRLDEPATVLDIMQTIWCRNRDNEKCDIPFAVCISKADTQAVQNVLSENLKRMLLDDVHGIKDESGFNRPLFNAQEYNPILNEL